MEALAEDRQRVEEIGGNGGGGSSSTTVPMDWQQRQSVNFLAIAFLTVTMSCLYLVAVMF